MIMFEKFGQHQPLNRQAERYALEGVPIALSTMADAVGSVCASLDPLLRLVEAHVLAAERLHADDTTVSVLAKGKTDTGRCWVWRHRRHRGSRVARSSRPKLTGATAGTTRRTHAASSSLARSMVSLAHQARATPPFRHRARHWPFESRRSPRPLLSQRSLWNPANVILSAVGHNFRHILAWTRDFWCLILSALIEAFTVNQPTNRLLNGRLHRLALKNNSAVFEIVVLPKARPSISSVCKLHEFLVDPMPAVMASPNFSTHQSARN
jgi:hypothetical protein